MSLLADFLKTKFNLHDIAVTSSSNGSTYGLIIEFSDVITGQEDFGSKLQQSIQQKFNLPSTTAFQFQQIAPAVGAIFWQTSITVTLAAIILLLLVVFFLFREFVPALAIILAGLFDVLAGLAAMPFFGISLSLPTISALLMLMGYSIDTDVLSASRVLKGVGKTSREQAVSSFKTGMMMTITALAAVLVMAVFSYFNQMIAIYEIGIVLFFGLIGDIIATWLMNMPILLWFVESKAAKKKSQR